MSVYYFYFKMILYKQTFYWDIFYKWNAGCIRFLPCLRLMWEDVKSILHQIVRFTFSWLGLLWLYNTIILKLRYRLHKRLLASDTIFWLRAAFFRNCYCCFAGYGICSTIIFKCSELFLFHQFPFSNPFCCKSNKYWYASKWIFIYSFEWMIGVKRVEFLSTFVYAVVPKLELSSRATAKTKMMSYLSWYCKI